MKVKCISAIDSPLQAGGIYTVDCESDHKYHLKGFEKFFDGGFDKSRFVVEEKAIEEVIWYGYHITGNKYLAIAINIEDPQDCHYFTIDPDVNNNAFIRAQGWAYPGAGSPEWL